MGYPRGLDEYSEAELVGELERRRSLRRKGLCDYCSHPAGQNIPVYQRSPQHKPVGGGSSCIFPERHSGEVDSNQLFLSDITETNLARCERWHPGFPQDDTWNLADWSNAMCGEAGELANVVKKIRRKQTGFVGVLDGDMQDLLQKAADEVADVYLYLNLVAVKLGVDFQRAIVKKFNEVSELQGFPERLR